MLLLLQPLSLSLYRFIQWGLGCGVDSGREFCDAWLTRICGMLPNEGGTYKVDIFSGWVSIVVWCNFEDMWSWLGNLWTHSDIQRSPTAASGHLNVEIDLVILISSGLLLSPFSFSIHGRGTFCGIGSNFVSQILRPTEKKGFRFRLKLATGCLV